MLGIGGTALITSLTSRAACTHCPTHAKAPVAGETFNYNPQDRMVFTSGTTVIPGVVMGELGPSNQHVMLREKLVKENDSYVYADNDPRQNSSLAFANAALTINAFLEVFPEDIKWPFKYDHLLIRPNCGTDLNANYKRESGTLNFYSDTDPVRGAHVHSGASADIVAHEVGHALLDAIRPEYMSSWGPEPSAFHESFGDMMSIHMALRNDRVVQQLIQETGGDLSKPNLVSNLAEELGTAVNSQAGKNSTGGNYLRNANNQLKFADPSTLSEKGGPNELGWGKHSLSRVWTGAHFDLLKAMVAERLAAGDAPEKAIRESNDELFKMLANMIRESPRGKFGYRDMAVAFIQSDKLHHQGQRAALIQKVFTDRNILPADLPAELLERDEASRRAVASKRSLFQSDTAPAFEPVSVTLGPDLGQFAGARVEVPVSTEESLFKSEHLQTSTERDIARLIQAGKIRYSDPHVVARSEDHYNPNGEVYEGAVVWEDGQMKIERLHISC
jgi:hypothetical protein